MGNMKLGLVGAGLRGNYTYGEVINESIDNCEIISVVEKRKGRREKFFKKYNIKEENVFETIEEFIEKELILDGVIIASGDNEHYNHISKLLEKEYNVLVELPVANTLDRLVNLQTLCEKYSGKLMMACNELRYDDFFIKIKDIIECKKLGELTNVQYNQDIGYINYTHNYIRGNWRIDSDTSPLILNQCNQDIDILLYLIDSKCNRVASFGSLKNMNNNNFKLNMGENCFQCSVENKCPYSAEKIYLENKQNINYAVHINPTKENLVDILKKGPYGRCVYKCDNNVVDNMVSIMNFENGVNVTLNVSGLTKESDKNIRFMFSNGEIEACFSKREIIIKEFGKDIERIIKCDSSHKNNLLTHFINCLSTKNYNKNGSTVKSSLQSHIIAFALEYSRISNEVTYIDDFYYNAVCMTDEIEKSFL